MSERDRAIKLAQELFQKKQQQGLDFSAGPCLADEILPDWCVDVAHSPRQRIDDRPENQCSSWREGRVHHFVELDEDGNVIRAV
jgi:hypothetical protein